jgi:hypothetical protein
MELCKGSESDSPNTNLVLGRKMAKKNSSGHGGRQDRAEKAEADKRNRP